MDVVVVAGNPKPASRTLSAGVRLAELVAPDAEIGTVDVIELGAGLLGWGDATVAEAVSLAKRAKLLVVASPTFKGTYTGVLKLFLDQFETATGLAGVTAVPLMLGAGPAHALAPELLLKPVLVEVGAVVPAQGLYVSDKRYDDPEAYAEWLDRWGGIVRRFIE